MSALRLGRLAAVAAVAMLFTDAAPAVADPQPPDLAGYAAVNAGDYGAVIPADWAFAEVWSGVVFEAPSGQRCSMLSNTRGGWVEVNCWGKMPNEETGVATVYNYSPGTFAERQGDLTGYNASLGEFRAVPAGSKITHSTAELSATCAVQADVISCIAERHAGGPTLGAVKKHGFVLAPSGNSLF